MSILMVMAVDADQNSDPKKAVANFKKGHVIAVVPDDHQFSEWELTGGMFDFIKTSATRDECRSLLAKAPPSAVKDEIVPCRIKSVDIDAIVADVKIEKTGDYWVMDKMTDIDAKTTDLVAIEEAVIGG